MTANSIAHPLRSFHRFAHFIFHFLRKPWFAMLPACKRHQDIRRGKSCPSRTGTHPPSARSWTACALPPPPTGFGCGRSSSPNAAARLRRSFPNGGRSGACYMSLQASTSCRAVPSAFPWSTSTRPRKRSHIPWCTTARPRRNSPPGNCCASAGTTTRSSAGMDVPTGRTS